MITINPSYDHMTLLCVEYLLQLILSSPSTVMVRMPQSWCWSRPHICHFSPRMYFLGSIFLHMKARKLWQNLPKFLKISPKIPKISPRDNFFSTNIICDICDKYELWHPHQRQKTKADKSGIFASSWCITSESMQRKANFSVFLSNIRKYLLGFQWRHFNATHFGFSRPLNVAS